jgi:hypothetical protein
MGPVSLKLSLAAVGIVRNRMDAIVVECDVLDHGLPTVLGNAVDKGDDAFPPLVEVDVFRMRHERHGRLRGGLRFLDRLGVRGRFNLKPS